MDPNINELADHEFKDNGFPLPSCLTCGLPWGTHPPTQSQIAASIGCDVDKIDRTVLNTFKTRMAHGPTIWTSFVDQGDPQRLAVFETRWPQSEEPT
jgi:hypothetical protein